MRVFHDISTVTLEGPSFRSVVAIGNFDGVHLGHQALVLRAIRVARKLSLPTTVLTFTPHPSEVLRPGTLVRRLTLTSEKLMLLEKLGVETVLAQHFTRELSELSAETFFTHYLLGLKASRIHVGNDFKFGHNRSGDTTVLSHLAKNAGMGIEIQPEVTYCGSRISSSAIRDQIAQGDFLKANAWLGRPYFLTGTIVRGDGRGQLLGFPTANLSVAPEKIFPPNGVYVTRVHWKDRAYRSIANIGVRPTFGALAAPIVEVHLFDFDESLYDECVRVELFEQVRAEKRFASKDELIAQIQRDVAQAKGSRSLD